ncbi:hypothetical protein [Cribrihabitans pelagius]|uniref:hypothetical protein n=1 Tax=Cribrihabitans pelagius TaxID=1765746 RepID=UPI003B5CFADD
MASLLSLLLPALLPSWRFFKTVEPSPRLEWALLPGAEQPAETWQEFRPRPQRIGPFRMALRLLWNPRGNETLFLVSCAERLTANPSAHTANEIHSRIAAELQRHPPPGSALPSALPYLQFRLVFHDRQEGALVRAVTYVSEPRRLPCRAAA